MTALGLIKSRDSMQSLILFIKDAQAQHVIAAWPLMGIMARDRNLKNGESFDDASAALWGAAHKQFSMDDLSEQADVPYTRCQKIFYRLVRAGVIYPDGTISPNASNLLVSTALAHVRSLAPRGKHEPSRAVAGGADVPKQDAAGIPKGRAAEPRANSVRQRTHGRARS